MALVLNVKKGEGFWIVAKDRPGVPDMRYIVESILDVQTFVLRKEGTDLAYRVETSPRKIDNNLTIYSGENTSRHSVRILIDAPRDLTILRDKLYEKQDAGHHTAKKPKV